MQSFGTGPSSLDAISIPSLQLPPFIVWIIVAIGFAIFVFQSAIIVYHWYMYAPSIQMRRKFLVIHGLVSGGLLFLTLVAAFIITLTR